jgi:DNA-binding GntR family transcriptional regulator
VTDLAALPTRAPRPGLADDVYDAIKTWIVDSVREPGVRANIEALARSLAVSPTPVREALARLDAEGLVVKEPLRGYTVVPPLGAAEVDDLFAFRLLLEPWAAGLAAERVGPDAEARLLAELATCPDAPDDDGYAVYRSVADHDQRFHDLLLELAGNAEARRAFAGTNCHLHLFRLRYGRGMALEAVREHRAVADAVVAGDPAAAGAAMRTHLRRSHARIAASFT